MDIISIYDDGGESDISITLIRKGIILGQKSYYFFSEDFGLDHEDGFLNFCFQYYGGSNDELPAKLLIDVQDENHQIISDAFKKFFNSEIKVVKPQKKWNRILDLNKEQIFTYKYPQSDKKKYYGYYDGQELYI